MRAISFIKIVLLLLAILIIMLFCTLRNPQLSLKTFGIACFVIETNSMSGEIEKGDVIIIEKTKLNNVNVGQNILFVNQNLKTYVVHKVVEKNNNILITAGIYPCLKMDSEYVTDTNFIGVAKQSEVLTILYKIFTNFLFWLIFLFVALLCMVQKYKYH